MEGEVLARHSKRLPRDRSVWIPTTTVRDDRLVTLVKKILNQKSNDGFDPAVTNPMAKLEQLIQQVDHFRIAARRGAPINPHDFHPLLLQAFCKLIQPQVDDDEGLVEEFNDLFTHAASPEAPAHNNR
jgi:hypothetical protein